MAEPFGKLTFYFKIKFNEKLFGKYNDSRGYTI